VVRGGRPRSTQNLHFPLEFRCNLPISINMERGSTAASLSPL